MTTNNSVNMGIQENADGGQVKLGITQRILKWLGADITLSGSGTNTHTFPATSSTLLSNQPGEINALTAKSSLVDEDQDIIEDSEAANAKKKVLWSVRKSVLKTYFDTLYAAIGSGSGIPIDGWISQTVASATRTSNTTFTTTTDLTAILQKGFKLKFTDTTTKYAYVVALSAYSAGSMTITIIGNTLVGNPSAFYYSNIENPFGFPLSFTYTPTTGGITLGNGSIVARLTLVDGELDVTIYFTLGSTSAITGGVTFSAPLAETNFVIPTCWLQDSGTNTFAGLAALSSGTFNVYAINASGTYMSVSALSSIVPYTWAVNDFIAVHARYPWAT